MEKINYSDIELKRKEKLETGVFCFNDIYIRDNEVYKLFKNTSVEKLKEVEKKLEAIKELNKDYIVSANKKIMDGDVLVGYTSNYINGDTLHSLIKKRDMLNSMNIILKASENLEDFHNSEGNPYIGDFHFSNIMVDKDNNPMFIDNDSFGINGIESNGIPACLYTYYDFKHRQIEKNQNTDRIAFVLAIFNRLADRDIFTISHFAYDDYVGRYPFLSKLYPVYFDLKRRGDSIPEIPYLHKVLK